MSTIILPQIKTTQRHRFRRRPWPPVTGSRAEFERRYLAHPEIKKAELLEGIVYMPSPVKYQRHASPHLHLNHMDWRYILPQRRAPRAVTTPPSAWTMKTIRSRTSSYALTGHGGRSFVDADDYLAGAPELSCGGGFHQRQLRHACQKRVYARNGVQEYLVFLTHDQVVHWFALEEGEYVELAAAADGILRSRVFPGLWLQPAAFWAKDLATMLAALQEGIASPAHQAFVERLAGVETSVD
ncbi:MAG: Uma2 family endonuclease [Caldilineaceae bacterium]